MEINIHGKEKKFNIRSWEDEGNSARSLEELPERWLKTGQVGVLEAKGVWYFRAEWMMNCVKCPW